MATKTLSATKMAFIIESVIRANAQLERAQGYSSTSLTLAIEWLMEAAISPVAVETVDTLETST